MRARKGLLRAPDECLMIIQRSASSPWFRRRHMIVAVARVRTAKAPGRRTRNYSRAPMDGRRLPGDRRPRRRPLGLPHELIFSSGMILIPVRRSLDGIVTPQAPGGRDESLPLVQLPQDDYVTVT